jgi:hypothetical protein
MKFNPEINLGNVIELLGFLAVVFGAVRKFGALEAKLNVMYEWFSSEVLHGRRRTPEPMPEPDTWTQQEQAHRAARGRA